MYLNFSIFLGRTSAGGGQALVPKRGQVSDGGGLAKFLPDGGPPVPPGKNPVYWELVAMAPASKLYTWLTPKKVISLISSFQLYPCGGGYSCLVLVRMCRRGVWKKTIQIQIFQNKSDPFMYQSAKFWTKSPNFSEILPLGKFWKIAPFIYQILHFIRGHSYIKRLILPPMLAAHPRGVFCSEYPLLPPRAILPLFKLTFPDSSQFHSNWNKSVPL